jgi:PKD repeat protein
VQLTDSSSGSFSKRIWDFGDGTRDSSTKDPSHTYTTEGTFAAKLTVSGNGGSDTARISILTWNPGGNPIQMAGVFLSATPAGDSQKVELTIKNYKAILPPNTFPPVTVDSIGLWYQAGKLPTSADSAVYRKKYLLTTLNARDSVYTDTITIAALPKAEAYCGFMTAICWSDGKRTPFKEGNGVLVLMRDSLPPPIALTLSGVYLPKDTARLYVAGISSIDTTRVDSMFIWYSMANDSANFTDKSSTTGLSMKEVKSAVENNQFPFSIVRASFYSAAQTIYFAVMLKGKNDRTSGVKKHQFTVGLDRPVNPLTLRAAALASNVIRVSWDKADTAGVDRIVIWYRALQPVDTVFDVSALKLDSLVPSSVTDTVVVSDKFNAQTQYYFGAQVYKNGLWSQITTKASATATTPAAGSKLDSNTVHLVKPTVWDTSKNTITVRWSVNRVVADSLDIGISYSTASMPISDTSVGQMITVSTSADSAVVKLREDIVFNGTYYVALWLRRPGGKWTDPTQGSSDAVQSPSFTWQSVVYFTKENDEVYAFNREVRLVNQPGDVSRTVNTVRYSVAPPAAAVGFTQVSTEIEFAVKDRGTKFFIVLKVVCVPFGYTLRDVRVYRDSAGLLLISREPIAYDATNGYVSILTNDLDLPLVALVDKRPPSHETVSSTDVPVPAAQSVTDTVVVRDNVANMTWRFLYARGGDAYDTVTIKTGGVLRDTLATLIVTIDSNFVTQDNGVRALLIIGDGVYADTVNLSRSVLRNGTDIAFTEEGKWVPLSVNAVLDTPDAQVVLRELSYVTDQWTYDNTKFRIFKCYPAPQEANPWKWVEYSDAMRHEFDFVRGNIVWVKALSQRTVRYGYGHTPSLKESFTLRIAPLSWTDFSVPFRFDITMGDILDASKSAQSAGDSLLEIYMWKRDVTSPKYFSELVFLKAMDDDHHNILSTPLSGNATGYTMFNPTPDTIILNIPPLPLALSRHGLAKKSKAAAGWAVRVSARESDGSSLGSAYCGYTKAASCPMSYYPLAPSFCSAHVGVYDQTAKRVYGCALAHAMKNGGYSYLIAFANDGAAVQRISYHLENLSGLPQGLRAAVYDAETGAFADFSKGDATVEVEANSKEYRTLLVGEVGYLAKAKMIVRPAFLALVGTYPNPFKGKVRIRYSLPYEGVKDVVFAIYNLSGKAVWRHEIRNVSRSGFGDLVWNGTSVDNRPIAAGVYILRMTALNAGRKPAGVFFKKMTLLP